MYRRRFFACLCVEPKVTGDRTHKTWVRFLRYMGVFARRRTKATQAIKYSLDEIKPRSGANRGQIRAYNFQALEKRERGEIW